MAPTRIDKVLHSLRNPPATEKVASEKPVAAKPAADAKAPREALKTALETALTEKTAGEQQATPVAPGPVASLEKIASEVASAEDELMVRRAKLAAAVFADEIVAKLAAYDAKASERATKTASVAAAPAGFAKLASEQPGLVREAAQLGYDQTRAALEKAASENYARGWNKAMAEVHEKTANEFYKAAAITNQVLHALSERK